MIYATPLPENEAPEAVQQTYGRIKEFFGTDTVPEVFLPFGRVESFLKDVYMNSKKFVFSAGKLDLKSKMAIAFAVAVYAKSNAWKDFFAERAKLSELTETQLTEICALIGANSLYNTFFKFRDLSGSTIFDGMPVGLRAHVFVGTSFDTKMVELINTVISNLNACKPCTSGHVTKARNLGITDDELLEAIQCGATVYSMTQFYNAVGL
jgi:alkyl hydroperoxide reductase subunit D